MYVCCKWVCLYLRVQGVCGEISESILVTLKSVYRKEKTERE